MAHDDNLPIEGEPTLGSYIFGFEQKPDPMLYGGIELDEKEA